VVGDEDADLGRGCERDADGPRGERRIRFDAGTGGGEQENGEGKEAHGEEGSATLETEIDMPRRAWIGGHDSIGSGLGRCSG